MKIVPAAIAFIRYDDVLMPDDLTDIAEQFGVTVDETMVLDPAANAEPGTHIGAYRLCGTEAAITKVVDAYFGGDTFSHLLDHD